MAFYAIGVDPSETIDDLEQQRQREGFPWPVADPQGSMLRDMGVVQQSTKVGIDSRGVIIYRDGFGQGDEDTWRKAFQELAGSVQ